jgi:hypothetical protein
MDKQVTVLYRFRPVPDRDHLHAYPWEGDTERILKVWRNR